MTEMDFWVGLVGGQDQLHTCPQRTYVTDGIHYTVFDMSILYNNIMIRYYII